MEVFMWAKGIQRGIQKDRTMDKRRQRARGRQGLQTLAYCN